MAGLKTAVILEAIETLDKQGMPGTLLVQELSSDLANENAYTFADKLNKRVQVVLEYSDSLDEDVTEEESEQAFDEARVDEKSPDASPKKEVVEKKPPKKDSVPQQAKPAKSVDDLLNEIV